MVEFASPAMLGFLAQPPHFLFFTGKGGVGKTSLATASALNLADRGQRILLVSTDPASNLDEMLGVSLSNSAVEVPGARGLEVLNIDPEAAAGSYRERVMAQLPAGTSQTEAATIREQLSGACTTEIAAFDEFANLLSGDAERFDHVIFDTAPTGHTLRLLSLPAAWTGFLAANERGASCLGPHSGLKMQESRFAAAMAALTDPASAIVILVARPEFGALQEAARTAGELRELGLGNQRLVINAVFRATDPFDTVARSIERLGCEAMAAMPGALLPLPRDEVPLRPFDTVGLPALRALLTGEAVGAAAIATGVREEAARWPALGKLADELASTDRGLIMVMGKGGVGKTTIAAALALGLLGRGRTVHLSTTDPAAHVTMTLREPVPGLKVSRIDPKEETRRYVDRIMATRAPGLDEKGKALLVEDLKSPCTEEVAVFHAFSRIVTEARSSFVVLDTAPTGHSLLLMDATAALQEDLRRAGIEPFAWVINRSLVASGTHDPLLCARLSGERRQMARIASGLGSRIFAVPWLPEPPVGARQLAMLTAVE